MKKLWVTYAWKDNEDLDVDYLLQELEGAGLDVRYDRRQLLTGQRLWDQIDQGITNPVNSDAWALVVSKHSLESEPCREELNYALQRALTSRGSSFPLIGIFVEPVDKALLPAAISTRLYVNIEAQDWLERVRSGVEGVQPSIASKIISPIAIKLHWNQGYYPLIVEIRPRSGLWNPCLAAILLNEKDYMFGALVRPAGRIPRIGTVRFVEGPDRERPEWFLRGPGEGETASPTMSMFIIFNRVPTRLRAGTPDTMYEIDLSEDNIVKA
ncbi:toll/interleukin-1 receptor domain-containing protein [Sphingomonas faeni]|uniref:toll/interleukin-1 receptor domain-containing protein n=1 Tax=Sphingomonas faeni TaxID=185950 RepID=UPI00334B51A6